jgi:hypothetical protein
LLTLPVTVTTPTNALAVIDGALCLLTRQGKKARAHTPLATAVVEFRQSPFRTLVREHPFGLLPGMPNLYCLDGAFRLQWLADWNESSDPFVALLGEDTTTLRAQTASGKVVTLDINTGRRLSVEARMAAVG